ncbi:nucleolar RNA-binding Nop10p family protein [Candidatus Woesearchaeota archaeon]|nr:nucleolar RNA-binding Nop10p family protein [Candidatus Woesearchaeota archaeon]
MIFVCSKCGEYTLSKICQNCRLDTISVKPAKYSPEDRYGHYRRIAKKNDLQI